MSFQYVPIIVEALPPQGSNDVDPNLESYAKELDGREPKRSTYTSEAFTDNTLLHQVFALKLQEGDDLASQVVSTPAAMYHIWKRIGPTEWEWVPSGAQPAALIYEVDGLGYLAIRPAE